MVRCLLDCLPSLGFWASGAFVTWKGWSPICNFRNFCWGPFRRCGTSSSLWTPSLTRRGASATYTFESAYIVLGITAMLLFMCCAGWERV